MIEECQRCKQMSETVEKRRQNTRYQGDESNFVTCCLTCFGVIQDYWEERWADYWRKVDSYARFASYSC